MPSERPYTEADLTGLKRDDLVRLVQRQQDKWPSGKFQKHKTNMKQMAEALTGPGSLFTTNEPNAHVQHGAAPTASASATSSVQLPILSTSSLQSSPGLPTARNNSNSVHVQGFVPPNTAFGSPAGARCSIKLLIDDIRSTMTTEREKISQDVKVPVRVHISGAWQTNSQDVLNALQSSISAIQGPARIGIDDPENAGYTILLAKISGAAGEAEEGAHPSSIWLNVTQSRSLKFTVSHIGGAKASTKRLRSETPPGTSLEAQSNPSTPRKVNKSQPDALSATELQWITEAANNTPGFEDFKHNQNRRLSNVERASQWRFAAAFSRKYHKNSWPPGIELSGGKTIRKNAIEAALGMKTTMLAQAVNMSRIVEIYSEGEYRATEVVDRVLSAEESGDGSAALVSFLIQWEKDHPVFNSSAQP
ncbi:hypothetical protein FB45DRAFT_1109289 [Roridomyces roridus]|uniref:Uncharacterized protein n=1 Tax=Roridomyces roridus TaxID=1738132 RepID=A0AAD7BAU4_9AGAR|nr:hypothetical protein FB45DRAFT_1109289 [Roridomyces roridus]